METLSEIIGVKAWQNDGISFSPTLLDNSKVQQKHPYLYFEFAEKSGQVAIRMEHWKGVKSNMKTNKMRLGKFIIFKQTPMKLII